MKTPIPATIDFELLKTMPLPDYGADDSKAERGKLLIIAGSMRLPGAALLAGRAALRAGCGTVRLAAPRSIALHLGIALPELMVIPLPETPDGTIAEEARGLLENQFAPCDAVVLGPGLDDNAETNDLCRTLIDRMPIAAVIDAQALLAYANSATTPQSFPAPRIWTPHDGEMAELTNDGNKTIDAEQRPAIARKFAEKHHSVCVLKGRETLIAAPDGTLYINTSGTRGLGTAGSGDVLAGIIGSLLAQGMAAAAAAAYGVHIHALAGEAVSKDIGEDGLLARDFLERIPTVIRYLRKRLGPESNTVGLRRSV